MLANAMEKSTLQQSVSANKRYNSPFGSTGRLGHDSTTFYAGRFV